MEFLTELMCVFLRLYVFLMPFHLFVLSYTVFVFILPYLPYYYLDVYLFCKRRQESCGFIWEGREVVRVLAELEKGKE